MFSYRLVRSKRKTLAIHFMPDGQIEVRAPLKLSVREIEKFLRSKQELILHRSEQAKERQMTRSLYHADESQTAWYFGRPHPVRFCDDAKEVFDGSCFMLPADEALRRKALSKWYREEAERLLPDMLREISSETGLPFEKVSVGSASTRWGSCGGHNEIRLSWKLILLPERCIVYVLLHELCHTKEHNHSARFWTLVEKAGGENPAISRKALRTAEREIAPILDWLKQKV